MRKLSLCLVLLAIFSIGTYFAVRKSNRTLLITGCARSGTTYISKILRDCNFEVRHEKMGKDGVSSWYAAANPPYRKRGVKMSKYHFDHIFHQVRHPLTTISSVYFSEDRHSWHYILKHTPEIDFRDPHFVKCAKYWYYWNLKAEELAEWRYRIEDIEGVWGEYCQRIGKELPRTSFEHTSKNTNTYGEHGSFSWEDLRRELDPDLYQNIVRLSLKYGYSVPENAR